MFCPLYKLFDRTGISIHEFESCCKECKYSDPVIKCKVSVVKNEKMSKEKFGWMIEDSILFDIPIESKSKNTRYVSIVSLVHPSESDIWVVYCLRYNKKDKDWSPLYRFYHNTDMKEFDTLMALNSYLKKLGYNGRKLLESDLLLRKLE